MFKWLFGKQQAEVTASGTPEIVVVTRKLGVPRETAFAAFVDRFARFAAATARVIREESDAVPCYSVVNEISYWAWAGDVAKFHPLAFGGGDDIKRQLVRATIAGIEAVRERRARSVRAAGLIRLRLRGAAHGRDQERHHHRELLVHVGPHRCPPHCTVRWLVLSTASPS